MYGRYELHCMNFNYIVSSLTKKTYRPIYGFQIQKNNIDFWVCLLRILILNILKIVLYKMNLDLLIFSSSHAVCYNFPDFF